MNEHNMSGNPRSLPKVTTPYYTVTLPSGRKISFRPFLVKEEKILLIAMEGEDQNEINNAIVQILNDCIQEEIDVRSLPMFDIEYLFIQLRIKSIGNISELNLRLKHCPCNPMKDTNGNLTGEYGPCIEPIKYKLNLEEISVTKNENHTNVIDLGSGMMLKMRYPTIEMSSELQEDDVESGFKLLTRCIDEIIKDEQKWDASDYSEEELEEFVNNFSQTQMVKIKEFLDTMPKLRHTIEVTCPKGEKTEEVVLEGLPNFFGSA